MLPGPFEKHTGGGGEKTARWLEGPEHIISWAVGHLVQLAEPEEYDDKYKKWRMADLPIVPSSFRLVVRDERSQKQMSVLRQLLGRDDLDLVVNACDAGREGELIFKYVLEAAGGRRRTTAPIKRLWLSSMTNDAMREALAHLRDDEDMQSLEAAAKSRSEADWIVGMNATRAATIRLRSSFDGAVSLGRVQTPDAGHPRPPRGGGARLRPRGLLARRRPLRGRRRSAATPGASTPAPQPRLGTAEEAEAIARGGARPGRHDHEAREGQAHRARADALRPHVAAARGEQPLRLLGAAHAGGGAALLRGAQGADLPAHELAVPDERHDRRAQADRRATSGATPPTGRRPSTSAAWTSCRWGASSPTTRSATTTRSSRPRASTASRRCPRTTGASTTSSSGASWPSSTPTRCSRTRGSRRPSPSTSSARAGGSCSCRAGAASTASCPRARAATRTTRARTSSCPRLERGERVDTREAEVLAKQTQPPRRYSDASLLGAMETAGKLVDDDELREAMKESGIGTPATRAAIIERLIDVGYVERDARALVPHREGHERHPPARRAPADLARADRRLGAAAWPRSSTATRRASGSCATSPSSPGRRSASSTPSSRTCASRARTSGPCPVCGHDIVENRKGFSCWSREDPGCGFVIWKGKAGKQLPAAVARELIARGRTEKPVTGFKGRSGRSFRARLALVQSRGRQVARRVRRAVGARGRQAAARPRRPRRRRRWRTTAPGPVRASRRPRAALVGVAAVAAAALAPAAPAAADPAGSLTKASGSVQATLAWSKGDFGVRRPTLTISRGGARRLRAVAALHRGTAGARTACWRPAGVARTRCSSSTSTPTASPRSSWTASPAARTAARSPRSRAGSAASSRATSPARSAGATAATTCATSTATAGSSRQLRRPLLRRLHVPRRLRHAGPGPAVRRRRTGAAAGHAPLPGAWSRRDLRRQRSTLRRARRQRYDARGIVAAIVADLYLLRRPRDARATLVARTRSGDLGSARSARAYRRALLRDLHRLDSTGRAGPRPGRGRPDPLRPPAHGRRRP